MKCIPLGPDTGISSDIRQNPVQVGFQKMPSGASLELFVIELFAVGHIILYRKCSDFSLADLQTSVT